MSSIDPEVLCEGSPGEVHKQAIDLMGQVEWVPCRGRCRCRCVFTRPGKWWREESPTIWSPLFDGMAQVALVPTNGNKKWVWINTYRYIFNGMNIHLPAILGFTRYQGFDPSPNIMKYLKISYESSDICLATPQISATKVILQARLRVP